MLFAASLVAASEKIVAPYFDPEGDLREVTLSSGETIEARSRAYRLRWQDYSQEGRVYGSTAEVEGLLAVFWL
jgi:hypothetical protein